MKLDAALVMTESIELLLPDGQTKKWNNGLHAVDAWCTEVGISRAKAVALLASTPTGNQGKIMLPWYEKEILPDSLRPQIYRFGLAHDDLAGNARALFEGLFLGVRIHHSWGAISTIGLSLPKELLPLGQLIADILGKTLHISLKKVADFFSNSLEWDHTFVGDPLKHHLYGDLALAVVACHRYILQNGPDPEGQRCNFFRRWK